MTNGITTMTEAGAASAGRLTMTPARWLTLVLGVPVLLALIGWTGFSAVAQFGQASYPVRATFPVSGHQLTAQIDGNITLRQVKAGGAELTGTAHYTLFRSTVTTVGDTVRFHCPLPINNGCDLNGTLQVPAATGVSLSTDGGDVNVPDFSGAALTLSTAGGNVTAGTLTGDLDFGTNGGDVTATELNGPVQLLTGGGNINVNAVADATRETTVKSDGGDVTMTFTDVPAVLTIASGGGNVTLTLPQGHYDFQTNTDGGSLSQPASDPTATGRIVVVDSEGGDVTISEGS